MVGGWWQRTGGTYDGGWRVDGAWRPGCIEVGKSRVWGFTICGVRHRLAVGVVCVE